MGKLSRVQQKNPAFAGQKSPDSTEADRLILQNFTNPVPGVLGFEG